MEVIVGTYEQVLVGFNVLSGDDELEVCHLTLKYCTLRTDFNMTQSPSLIYL